MNSKKKSLIAGVCFLLAVIIVLAAAVCTEGFTSFSKSAGTGNCSTSNKNTSYKIEYITAGDGTNLVDFSVNGPTTAMCGETVMFTVTLKDKDYYISQVCISARDTDELEISETSGVYMFTMPRDNTLVHIYLAYNPEIVETTQYRIEYDARGSGSLESLNFNCPPHAGVGDKVTFTVTLVDLSDIYDDYYPLKITAILLNDLKTGEEICVLGSGEGTFSFTMPECDVTIMFYLMSK